VLSQAVVATNQPCARCAFLVPSPQGTR